MFTNGNRWRFRGEAVFNRWPDRNYGRGNDAGALLAEIEETGNAPDTLNYLNISYNRINFMPAALWRVSPNFYIGPRFELENLDRFSIIPEEVTFLNADSSSITGVPMEGLRSGLGLQLLLDTRDYILNPIRGTFIEANTQHFFPWLGSDYVYHNFQLDARHYINTTLNHTLALRGLLNFRFSEDPIPFRGLSRVGGRDFIRGYFKGTYQDNHMLGFELEYRLPFWREDSESGFWQLWKRLGVAAFLSGAQVQPEVGDFRFNRFRLAAGAGLRILFNQESRVNLRIDYAIGLAPNAAGPEGRQTGLYFFLAEAF
jgi:outer membrane protein assembly factor BamA